jgi:gas vesicle protein
MSRYDFDDDDRYVVIENHSAGVGPFLVGLAVGAGIALLFAPRSGEATRRDIKRRAMRVRRAAEQVASDVADTVTDSFNDARKKVEEKIDAAREAVDMKRQQVQRAMEAGRAAAREARSELEHRLAETKAAYNAGVAVARNGRTLDDPDGAEG